VSWCHPIVGFVSNLGYLYCVKHKDEEFPHKVPGHTHKIDVAVREGYEGETCDWPLCGVVIQKIPAANWEHVNQHMQEY